MANSCEAEDLELWVKVLRALTEGLTPKQAKARVHATFGLINSTPHTTHRGKAVRDKAWRRNLLETMAWAALKAE